MFTYQTTTVSNSNYPPFNIIKTGSVNIIQVAVPFASKEELDVTVEKQILTVTRTNIVVDEHDQDNKQREYLVKRIGSRNFKQQWKLDEFVEVNNVSLNEGILEIEIERNVPKDQQPKSFKIK